MNKIIWFIVRRVAVYSTIGAIIGAVWGAICIGLAGAFIGEIIGWLTGGYLQAATTVGGRIGLRVGAITGGSVGLLGFGIVGIVAPPARSFLPAKNVIGSMIKMMALATVMGVTLFLLWSAIFGFFRDGFNAAVQKGAFIAIFAGPVLLGLGQIVGIWRAILKLKKVDIIEAPI